MLVLTRRVGQSLRIGEDVSVTIVGFARNQVRLGVTAPTSITVHREEIFERIAEQKRAAALPKVGEPVRNVLSIQSNRMVLRRTER
jgi:carbon storage regulator